MMSEIRGEKPEQEPEVQLTPELEQQPQAEMPEDFEDPEGKVGKWKEVTGEVEIEGKKVEVKYREKVIELPKHRQEETGIKRIRRRELLPPLSEEIKEGRDGYSAPFELMGFLTDDRLQHPDKQIWCHWMNWMGGDSKSLQKHKEEGIYFQEIYPQKDSFYKLFQQLKDGSVTPFNEGYECSEEERKNMLSYSQFFVSYGKRDWVPPSKYNTRLRISVPNYIFGNHNPVFKKYIETILQHPFASRFVEENQTITGFDSELDMGTTREILTDFIEGIEKPYNEAYIPIIRAPGIPKFRWCDAECALIPTKRSLNVLFFETGEENRNRADVDKES